MNTVNRSDINDNGAFIAGAIQFVSNLSSESYTFTRPQFTLALSPMAEAVRLCEGALRRYEAAQHRSILRR